MRGDSSVFHGGPLGFPELKAFSQDSSAWKVLEEAGWGLSESLGAKGLLQGRVPCRRPVVKLWHIHTQQSTSSHEKGKIMQLMPPGWDRDH